MSRSWKKTKIFWFTTATSEKNDKRHANRKLRRIVKQGMRFEDAVIPHIREISNVWCFDKDGKRYNPNLTKRDLRK